MKQNYAGLAKFSEDFEKFISQTGGTLDIIFTDLEHSGKNSKEEEICKPYCGERTTIDNCLLFYHLSQKQLLLFFCKKLGVLNSVKQRMQMNM